MSEHVAIVGSRDYMNVGLVRAYVYDLPIGTTVVSGGAPGVDTFAEKAALERSRYRGEVLHITILLADWNRLGKAAGPIRNTEIVEKSDRVVAFWDGKSRGTQDTIRKALRAKKPVVVFGEDGKEISTDRWS